MHLDRQHPVPVYLQLKEMLQSQIEQGVYFPHQKLPSERHLCQHYDLSRMTARRALQELIDIGLAYTRVGKGTFVSENANNLAKDQASTAKSLITFARDTVEGNCQKNLIKQFLDFNFVGVEQAINEALATYPLEAIALELFPRVIRQLEQQWHEGLINLSTQRYAITTLHSQLVAMFNAAKSFTRGPKVLLACAPGDQHEIGLLSLALGLRRQGFAVIYLGPSVITAEFSDLIEAVQPQLICFSAATTGAAQVLAAFSRDYGLGRPNLPFNGTNARQKPIFAFGGIAFAQNPKLASTISGLYLGDTVKAALFNIQQLPYF